MRWFALDFIKNVEVNLTVKSKIERLMESIPQAIKSEAQLTIIVDSLNSGEFSSLNPIYQFPRALTLVCYLLNFVIKVGSLDIFDSRLEFLPVIETS